MVDPKPHFDAVIQEIQGNARLSIDAKSCFTDGVKLCYSGFMNIKLRKAVGYYDDKKPSVYDQDISDASALWRGYFCLGFDIVGSSLSQEFARYMHATRKLEDTYFKDMF